MAVFVQENLVLVVLGLLVLAALLVWALAAGRKAKVQFAAPDDGTPARRNQALIDAAPAAVPVIPPAVPGALAGVGEAVASQAAPAPVTGNAAVADDLSRIKGLGPKLVEQLHALGVTELSQIAAWGDADIDRIDGQLGRFAGRIRRDNWVEQARLLGAEDMAGYEEKFGRI